MFSSAVHFAVHRCSVAALLALCLPVAAQQNIQFSRPANQDPAVKPEAMLPDNHSLSPGAFNAPSALFGNGPSANFDPLPGASLPIMPNANSAQMQKALEDKKNWTLLTPEEILGVPTPEKILGIDNLQEDAKLSPTERYLQRRDREAAAIALTNALRRSSSAFWHDDNNNNDSASPFFRGSDLNNHLPTVAARPGEILPDGTHNLNPFFRPTSKSLADMNQSADTTWSSPFGASEPLPKPNPEQLAGMDRFRALMEPPAPPKPATAPTLYSQPAPMRDRNLQQMPLFNPAGHSYTAVGNNIGMPTGLTPLAGVSGPAPVPPKRAPLVQPPPWVSSSPQNFGFPQRQF